MLAAEFPFRRIVGVELTDSLHRVAVDNVRRCRLADRIDLPATWTLRTPLSRWSTVIFLFNPFGEEVLRQVVRNLGAAWQRKPRPIRIIYRKPIWTGALDAAPFLKKIESRRNRLLRDYSYSIYADSGRMAGPSPAEAIS